MKENPAPGLRHSAAVVTGSSSGIGRAIAVELATHGADVLVHARRSAEDAEETARLVRELGREAHVFLSDLSGVAGQDALVEEAFKWRPNVSVWVNNAGADVLTGEGAGDSFEEKLETLWRVDVTATMRVGRQAGRRMKQAGGGALVNIGWDQAAFGMEGNSGELFAATKGAIMSFTLSLAKSLAPEVRVNCVAPGWIQTAWGEDACGYWQERAVAESLLARWGTPEDVARAVRFLASPEAGFVNGQILAVNGGFWGAGKKGARGADSWSKIHSTIGARDERVLSGRVSD